MKHIVWAVALGGLLGAVAASAQSSASVFVAFRFDAEKAVRSFKLEDLPAAELEVGGRIARLCQQKLSWWSFEPATAADQFPRLDVWLVEGVDWQLGVAFAADATSPTTDTWTGLLFKPTDFAQLAPTLRTEGWGPTIVRQFEREVLRRHTPALLKKLQNEAPLGRVVTFPNLPVPTPDAPVVLPLEWERYKPLSASLFTIRCRSNAGPVTLHSAGLEVAGKFTKQQSEFDGIAVRLCEWQEINDQLVPIADRIDRLGTLQPVAFFLKEHRRAWALAP